MAHYASIETKLTADKRELDAVLKAAANAGQSWAKTMEEAGRKADQASKTFYEREADRINKLRRDQRAQQAEALKAATYRSNLMADVAENNRANQQAVLLAARHAPLMREIAANNAANLAARLPKLPPPLPDNTPAMPTFGEALANANLAGGNLPGNAFTKLSNAAAQAASRTKTKVGELARSAATGVASMAKSAVRPIAGLVADTFGSMGRMTALGLGLGAVASPFLAFGGAMSAASGFEDAQTQFTTLLKSADAAKARVSELQKFADFTPFDLAGTVQASRVLEVLTKGAMSTGKGLTLVGDVASGTGLQFEESAMWVGRLFDALNNNRPAGEALMRLQEVGAIAGDARGEIEDLVKRGLGPQAWQKAEQALGRFSGGMARLSQTFTGRMSTLGDAITGIFRAFGLPVMEALKPIISAATALANQLQEPAKRFGETIAKGMGAMAAHIKDGTLWSWLFSKVKEVWANGISASIANLDTVANAFAKSFIPAVKTVLSVAVKGALVLVGAYFTRYLPFLTKLIAGAGLIFVSAILKGIKPMVDTLGNMLYDFATWLPWNKAPKRNPFTTSSITEEWTNKLDKSGRAMIFGALGLEDPDAPKSKAPAVGGKYATGGGFGGVPWVVSDGVPSQAKASLANTAATAAVITKATETILKTNSVSGAVGQRLSREGLSGVATPGRTVLKGADRMTSNTSWKDGIGEYFVGNEGGRRVMRVKGAGPGDMQPKTAPTPAADAAKEGNDLLEGIYKLLGGEFKSTLKEAIAG